MSPIADNTPQTGTATIAADDVTTLNGGASSGVLVQRVKVAFGDDGDSRDVSTAFPLPFGRPDSSVTGTITALDAVLGVHAGAGTPLSGTPTANSYVAFAMKGGESGFTLRLSGTFGANTVVWMESSVDSTNGIDGLWTTNLVRQSGIDTTFLDASLTAPGIFRGVAGGYAYLRVRATGTVAPNISVAFRASSGPSVTALVASLPPGSNSIGSVNLVSSGGMTPIAAAITASGANTPNTQSIANTTGQVVANVALAGNATFHVVTSAFNGTLSFEASVDGGLNYAPSLCIREDGTGSDSSIAINTSTYSVRQYTAALAGFQYFRVRASTFTSGTAAIIIAPGPFLIEPSPSLAASTANIGAVNVSALGGAATLGPAPATQATAAGVIGPPAYATGTAAVTTSAALVVAPAAGLSIYVTDMEGSNGGAADTRITLFEGATTRYARLAGANGGGFVTNLRTPWKLPAATALNYQVSIATTWFLTCNYYIAA